MDILGVGVDNLSREEVFGKIRTFLHESRFHRVSTVNPEFLVRAERNPEFRQVVESADLRVVDGFGIALVAWLRGGRINRVSGSDLAEDILRLAEDLGLSVFFAVREGGFSSYEEVRSAVLERYPKLRVFGADIRSGLAKEHVPEATRSEIILCGFGAPEQEFFLESFRVDPGNIRLVVGVGGTFDFFTGRKRRAPVWMRDAGLEWLWRLMLQPNRVLRIWDATAVFLWKALAEHWK